MKHLLFLRSLLLFAMTTSFITTKAIPVCFQDIFGYTWSFPNLQSNGDGTYFGTGTVDAYSIGRATIWLDLSCSKTTGTAEIHAVNANPDNCTNYSDSFIYIGLAVVNYDGENLTYLGNGSWQSFCSGTVINAGTWSGQGPCSTVKNKVDVPKGPYPAKANQIAAKGLSLNIAPNPVKNFVQLHYTIAQAAKVNITVYDLMQRPVKILVNENKNTGNYSIAWNLQNAYGAKLQAGLYKVVIRAGDKMYSHTLQVE